jgi:HPt (histidine-containing phosphotransfer) domain-containing protein
MKQQADGMAAGATFGVMRALDRELALSRVGGDLELLQEIAQLFVEDASRMLGEIRSAVEARDAAQLDRSAHTLKGCVSNFGAQRLYDAALRLERMGRGGDLAHVDAAFRTLELEVHQLVRDLRSLVGESGTRF